LDLSGTDPDHKQIIGWPDNGGDNQKWFIEDLEDTGLVVLKNVLYHKYVGFAGELRPGAPAIGVPHKREWVLRREAQGLFRFFTPDSELNLELSGRGSDKGGTPVVLAIMAEEKYQTWRIEEVIE